MMDTATVTTECEKCQNGIEINQRWTPGGVNDYGGFVLQCGKCSHVFDLHLGRDIDYSEVNEGAKVLAKYNDERGDKQAVLAKFGLA